MSAENEPRCTCGVGTMFYSYLHEDSCPFSKAGVLPPPTKEEPNFSHEDVEVVRAACIAIAHENPDTCAYAFYAPRLNSIADRIEALLPPEEK